MNLHILPERFAIWKLPAQAALPQVPFFAAVRTHTALSLVTTEELVPGGVACEHGWRALEVAGPLDFSLTGVLASLAAPLADANIPIFVLSSFDTDYILVKDSNLSAALSALEACGHVATGEDSSTTAMKRTV